MDAMTPLSRLLGRLRAATGGVAGLCATVGTLDVAILPEVGGDLVEAFTEALRSAGGEAFVTGVHQEEVLVALAERLRAVGATGLFIAEDDVAAREFAMALVPFGPFVVFSEADLRALPPPCSAGFQTVDAAVAESGAVVQSTRGGRSLLPGILPDVHVALVPGGSLVPRMEDVLARFSADMPRAVSFVTGPSRTADIEQTIVVGAHGPKSVIAVVTP